MATTQITLNVDNTILNQAITALDWANGWSATIPNANGTGTIPNPVSASQAAKNQIIAYVRGIMVDYANSQSALTNTPPASGLIS